MKRFFAIIILLYSSSAIAQNIGIGTNNPQNKLHIAGDLRIDSLASLKDSGLVLHNRFGVLKSLKFTGNKTDVLHGDGTFAAALAAENSWLTTGNAGTNPSVNFLGTTDGQPLRFRVNNNWAGQISLSHSLVSFGINSLQSNTTGSDNVAIGGFTLENNSTGFANIAIGTQSMSRNSSGNSNIGIGSTTLFANNTGYENIAIGVTSLASNTTGNNNLALGTGALGLSTTGAHNIAIGYFPLSANKTGSFLLAVGYQSLYSNTNGMRNSGFGYRTLFFNSTGSDNTAVGYNALFSNTIASRNTAVGHEALYSNTVGASNVAVGSKTLWSNTKGYSLVAMGDSALYYNTGGLSNTAVGELAMQNNTTGSYNVAYGSWSLLWNLTGHRNTAVGHEALAGTILGSGNTAQGFQALITNYNGGNNTAIGYGADVTNGGLFNATAIGYNAKVNASNKIRLGNASVTRIEGQVPFTTPSDGRYKFNVLEDVKGLEFIMKLRPVTYQFDVKKFDGIDNNISPVAYNLAESIRRTGFIAQEVEAAAIAADYNFSGISKPQSSSEHYSLSYESFVVPLVKGMQEQQRIIAKQGEEIAQLKLMIREQQLITMELKEQINKMKD